MSLRTLKTQLLEEVGPDAVREGSLMFAWEIKVGKDCSRACGRTAEEWG